MAELKQQLEEMDTNHSEALASIEAKSAPPPPSPTKKASSDALDEVDERARALEEKVNTVLKFHSSNLKFQRRCFNRANIK